MAKLKTTATADLSGVPVTDLDSLSLQGNGATPLPEGVTVKEEVPAFVADSLKVYPGYKALYVDAHGGVFTVDTPEAIRGNAKLYENPFYQS